ncbi:MAG: hypothetical protein IKW60_06045 [Clostridia bacterium]|nr:hypothetical protein [Clostridia bacterium]
MKKFLCLLGVASILLTMAIPVFAGSIPEDLLSDDNAKLYIGRVDGRTTLAESTIPYEENKVIYIDITPVYKYKGDVELGMLMQYKKNNFGSFIPEKDGEYLFGYIDENNFYIYEIASRDENSIKLVDADKYDMTKRLEDYINAGAFAMAEEERLTLGKEISFTEYLYQNPSLSSSAVEKVTFRYQDELYQVDKDKFFQIAEEIMVTGAKNTMLYETKTDSKTPMPYETVLYIELLDADDKPVYFSAVSRFGEVDTYALFMSRLMQKDYEMKPEDVQKLYTLFPTDVQKKLKTPERLPSEQPLELPVESPQNHIGVFAGIAAFVFIVAFTIGVGIRKRKQK